MLVLSRKLSEAVVITTPNGERIRFVVVDIDRGKIRVGIEAPRTFPVHREEIQQAIDAKTREKAQ